MSFYRKFNAACVTSINDLTLLKIEAFKKGEKQHKFLVPDTSVTSVKPQSYYHTKNKRELL